MSNIYSCLQRLILILLLPLLYAQTEEAQPQALLQYLPRLEEFRKTIPLENIRRIGHVDVIGDLEGFEAEVQKSEIGICHFAHLFEATALTPDLERTLIKVFGSWEGVAAISLAVEHMNTGRGVVVPEVEGLNEKCNIRFTLETFDNENVSKNDAVEEMIKLTDRIPVEERLPCAVIGPYISRNALASALLLGIRGYPQVSPSAASPELDLKAQYPLFGRTVASNQDSAELVILYLYHRLNVRHLAVVHHPDEFGSSYALGLQLAAKKLTTDMRVETVEMVLRLNPEDERKADDIKRTVEFLKNTGFTYFFSAMHHDFHDPIMEEAFNQGIAGTGKHNWFFAETLGATWVTGRLFEKGSPLHLAHVGASRFSAVGGIPGLSPRYEELERLLKQYKNPQDVAFLRSILPKYETHNSSVFDDVLESEEFLQTAKHPAAFAYDAAIALGLSACDATTPDEYFEGSSHFASFGKTAFHGATGKLAFDPATGSRLPQSMTFELVNHQIDPDREEDDMVGFKTVRTSVFDDGLWNDIEPLVFNDGTSEVPTDLPGIELEEHLLTPALRAGGLLMCAIALTASALFALWTWVNQTVPIVKAAQPIFLYLICAGTFILASAIIPLSLDRAVLSEDACGSACMAVPWLVTIGFSVAMSALYAKTQRVYRIVKNGIMFRRVQVRAADVYWPMLVILGANILILALWTAISPIKLDIRIKSTDNFGRVTESYSVCDWSDSTPFYVSLGVINFLLLCYALLTAWKTRYIATELSETEYIYRAMSTIAMVCFMGVPVIILASENSSAFYYVTSGIIFVSSCSILLLIFCPKVAAFRASKRKDSRRKEGGSSLSEFFRKNRSRNAARYESGSMKMSDPTSSTCPDPDRSNEDAAAGIMIVRTAAEDVKDLESQVKRLLAETERLTNENRQLRSSRDDDGTREIDEDQAPAGGI